MGAAMQKAKYQAYLSATKTVAKTRQIVMLYDGAIRFLQQAKEAIREKRIEDRYHLVTKASDIISGLQGCLDFENGGQVARVLYGFYSAVDARLFALHRNNSIETCDEIIADLKQMRDVWQEIDEGNASGASSEGASEPNTAAPAAGPDQTITLSA